MRRRFDEFSNFPRKIFWGENENVSLRVEQSLFEFFRIFKGVHKKCQAILCTVKLVVQIRNSLNVLLYQCVAVDDYLITNILDNCLILTEGSRPKSLL